MLKKLEYNLDFFISENANFFCNVSGKNVFVVTRTRQLALYSLNRLVTINALQIKVSLAGVTLP